PLLPRVCTKERTESIRGPDCRIPIGGGRAAVRPSILCTPAFPTPCRGWPPGRVEGRPECVRPAAKTRGRRATDGAEEFVPGGSTGVRSGLAVPPGRPDGEGGRDSPATPPGRGPGAGVGLEGDGSDAETGLRHSGLDLPARLSSAGRTVNPLTPSSTLQ